MKPGFYKWANYDFTIFLTGNTTGYCLENNAPKDAHKVKEYSRTWATKGFSRIKPTQHHINILKEISLTENKDIEIITKYLNTLQPNTLIITNTIINVENIIVFDMRDVKCIEYSETHVLLSTTTKQISLHVDFKDIVKLIELYTATKSNVIKLQHNDHT